jgi:F-type H+-transporting ATPase subunit c
MEAEVAQSAGEIAEAVRYISAALCAVSMIAAVWGVTKIWVTIITTVGRNPTVKPAIDIYGWAGFATVEAIALYALVVALVTIYA